MTETEVIEERLKGLSREVQLRHDHLDAKLNSMDKGFRLGLRSIEKKIDLQGKIINSNSENIENNTKEISRMKAWAAGAGAVVGLVVAVVYDFIKGLIG